MFLFFVFTEGVTELIAFFLKPVSSLDPMKIWKRKWTWVFGSSFLIPTGTVFCNMFRPAKSSCSSIWISFEHKNLTWLMRLKENMVLHHLYLVNAQGPPNPRSYYTLDCSMLHVTSWDAPTFWFSKSWGATANISNKPNGNVFALPCFELFHRCPSHTWGEQLARLAAAPPGFQFPRGPVPTLLWSSQWYTKSIKIQPNTHKMEVEAVWSWYAWWCQINHPNLNKFGEDFSKIHYESSPAKLQKNSRFFFE